MKKLAISILTATLLTTAFYLPAVSADHELPEENTAAEVIQFSVFTRDTCSHCQKLEEFLETEWTLEGVQAKMYHLEEDDTYELFADFCDENGLVRATPTILIGDKIIQGFTSSESTGAYIMELAAEMTESGYFEDYENGPDIEASDEVVVHLPLLGTVDLKNYSLGILAVVLGFVDGFNPCAMWVLIMFITLLLQAGNRRKMFELAGIFVIAETAMYYLILNVWYKTWDFVKLDAIITPIIGVVSIAAGSYFLYEFFTNKDNECKVTSVNQKRKISARIKELVDSPLSIGIFFATLGLALSVNIVEFACSIGIPQAFTKILDLNELTWVVRQIYILIYTFFYMVDDFIVFGIALWSFEHLHLTTKYTRYCLIIGGTIMLILGYFFIFDPSKLVL